LVAAGIVILLMLVVIVRALLFRCRAHHLVRRLFLRE